MGKVSDCYMHAAAIGAKSLLASLTATVRSVDDGSGTVTLNHVRPLCTLMAHYALGRKPNAPAGWAPIGPYASAANGKLRSADYEKLAEYHLKDALDPGGEDFQHFPNSVIPFELMAIERHTGVPIGDSTHPLLTHPLAQRRTVTEIRPTEELEGVVRRASIELGLDFST